MNYWLLGPAQSAFSRLWLLAGNSLPGFNDELHVTPIGKIQLQVFGIQPKLLE
jgi:hypothetical protein